MTVLYSQTITTPLGQMLITASTRGVCLAEFAGTPRMERESRDLERLFKARTEPGGNEHTAQAAQELSAYFRGEQQRFTVALDTPGTDFQRQVWTALRDIPYGTTSHYQALAATIGKPAAVRAVAAANGATALPSSFPATASSASMAHSSATAAACRAKRGCFRMSTAGGIIRCRICL